VKIYHINWLAGFLPSTEPPSFESPLITSTHQPSNRLAAPMAIATTLHRAICATETREAQTATFDTAALTSTNRWPNGPGGKKGRVKVVGALPLDPKVAGSHCFWLVVFWGEMLPKRWGFFDGKMAPKESVFFVDSSSGVPR